MNGPAMTSLGDLLLPNAIVPRARWKGRKQVLAEMSGVMAGALGLSGGWVMPRRSAARPKCRVSATVTKCLSWRVSTSDTL